MVVLVGVLVLSLSGCGGDGTAEDGGTAEPVPTQTQPGSETAAGGATVTVQDIAFQDQSVAVAVGVPATWVNQDDVAHTVTAGTPGSPTGTFDEQLPAGGEVSITVDEAGTYAYFCQIHPNMTAELVVEPAAG